MAKPILGVTDTLNYLIYFEAIRKRVIDAPSLSLIDLVKAFHELNPHSIRAVVLEIRDTTEQLEYFSALQESIKKRPKMSSVELAQTFLEHHPDTLKGQKVAVNIDGETRLMRRGEVEKMGLKISNPNAARAEKLKQQFEERKTNVNDTNQRSDDTG